ncbi:MAG: hypothetical protein Q9171_005381 [Xanthocarpia ochracea]
MDTPDDHTWKQNIPRRKPLPSQSKPTTKSVYKQVPISEDQDGHILHTHLNLLDVTADVVLCLTPLSFVILAGIALSLDGKPLSALGQNVQAWTLLSPTIFPLVFAAIVGRTLNFFARLRLEQGSSLGVLEQLVGSQTVFGAFWVQVVLRSFNALGVFLILLWLISPLGGQASLRLITRDIEMNTGSRTLACVNSTGTTSSFAQAFAQTLTGSAINALYIGCLVAPLAIKDSAQDTWGNIKIPRFETYNRTLDDQGYATVPEEGVDWISLLGQPVAGLESGFDSNFTMRTWYHDLECFDPAKVPASSDWISDNFGEPFASQTNASTIWRNGRDYSSWRLVPSKDLEAYDPDKLKFVWLSKSGPTNSVSDATIELNYNEVFLTKCSMTVTHVEVRMMCRGLSCKPTKIRSVPPPTDWAGSLLNTGEWNYFSDNLFRIDTRSAGATSSVTEHYIYGHVESPFQYGASTATAGYLDMTNVLLPDFTRRLRTVLNTYFIASLAPGASTGTMSSANATRLLDGEDRIQGGFYELGLMAAAATISSSTDIYRCSKTFFALAIISSAILFITGVAGVVAKYCCRGPDMLGLGTVVDDEL